MSLEQNLIKLDGATDIFDPLPHYVNLWIPQDEVTLLAGHGGGGKSYVALSIAIHVALGLQFGTLNTTKTNVLFFSAEDGSTVLRQRVARLCLALKIDVSQLEGRLHILDASDIDPALHREQRTTFDGLKTLVTETRLLNELSALVQKLDVGLVVIDNASDTYDDDEIKRARVRSFVRSLRTRISRPGRAVLLLAHVNKASVTNKHNMGREDYSGSTAWHNSVRSRLSLTAAGDDAIIIEHLKANLGTKAEPIRLEWNDGAPLVVGALTNVGAKAAAAISKMLDDTDKRGLVAMIQGFDKRRETVTTSAQGNSTVFHLLRGEPFFPKNTDSHRLMRLLRELEGDGRIFRRVVITAQRKKKEVFTCTLVGPDSASIESRKA